MKASLKMQLNSALVLASVIAMSAPAFAQTEQSAETTTKVEKVTPNQVAKKAGEADVDEVITNRKLRAETGAKSKYSFSTTLGYSGGTVNNPGSAVRPNISSTVYVPANASLSGTLGMKYKISSLQSISADVGITSYTPFHSGQEKSLKDRTTIADPSLTYQVVYQAAGIQNVSALSLGYTTNKKYRETVGQVAGISFGQTAIYDFGGSVWSVGLAGELGYTAFDKDRNIATVDEDDNGVKTPSTLGKQQGDYSIALYPFAEVNISESLNFRTVFRPWVFEHNRSSNFGEISRATYTQSVGLGISVTRDIYLYPNVQFAPLNLKADRTNVGLSLNLNI